MVGLIRILAVSHSLVQRTQLLLALDFTYDQRMHIEVEQPRLFESAGADVA